MGQASRSLTCLRPLNSVSDDNSLFTDAYPLFMDASYGQRSLWGRNIAPPTYLYNIDSTIVAPKMPGALMDSDLFGERNFHSRNPSD